MSLSPVVQEIDESAVKREREREDLMRIQYDLVVAPRHGWLDE